LAQYFIRRVIGTIPLIAVLTFLIFIFLRLIPGDPARMMLDREVTTEDVER
jgi:glutathione transport system permease protein